MRDEGPLTIMLAPCFLFALQGKEAYFTDDGFAIGVAYILAILNQDKVRCVVAHDARRLCSDSDFC